MPERKIGGSKARAKAKRRTRSPHLGVVLVEPSGRRAAWRMRFTDPETSRIKYTRIAP